MKRTCLHTITMTNESKLGGSQNESCEFHPTIKQKKDFRMKDLKFTTILITMAFIAIVACTSPKTTNTQKVDFGIYELVMAKDIPGDILDSLQMQNIVLEENLQIPVIGYILKTDTVPFNNLDSIDIRWIKSAFTVDKHGNYQALYAVSKTPLLQTADLQKAKQKGQNVEIYFNQQGAVKWADATRLHIGAALAFTIDDEVVTAPTINGEIANGVALINGLENEASAKNLSENLNASLPE